MTLYTHIDSNIRKTWFLLSLFLVLIIGLGWLFSRALSNPAILYGAIIFSLAINIISYWHSDKIILRMTRAKPIEKRDSPELYRLMENLAITAGLPAPKIYILEESQPNAFALGRDPRHGVVAVTRGLLEKLEKPELEGVLAHEMSHIGNRDTLLAMVAVILVGMVAIMSDMFLRMGGSMRGNRDDEGRGGNVLALAAVFAAILAPFAAIVLQLAISRKREFLADASGALLTRYPQGLANALAKIAIDLTPLQTVNTSTAHLYFSNPFRGRRQDSWLFKIFSTHPPVNERIKALREMSV